LTPGARTVTFRFPLQYLRLYMRNSFADGLFWLSVACCAIAQFFIIRSVRGSRHVPEPSASVPHSGRAMEMMWAVLPAVGLAVLLVFTWRAVRDAAEAPPAHVPGAWVAQ
jgi:heme/copper-type cytochrome/quinol oxidase subunit 2